MRLYGIDLPEVKKENAEKILTICKNIHLNYIKKRQRNTIMQKWDNYWVKAYSMIIKEYL